VHVLPAHDTAGKGSTIIHIGLSPLIAAWKSHQLGKILFFENFAYTGQKIYQARGALFVVRGFPHHIPFKKLKEMMLIPRYRSLNNISILLEYGLIRELKL
jgi:hypothetical protein